MTAKQKRRAAKKVRARERPRLICANCRRHVADVLGGSDRITGLVTVGQCPHCGGEYGAYVVGELERVKANEAELFALVGELRAGLPSRCDEIMCPCPRCRALSGR